MFCKECGKMIQDGSKYCTGCGKKIEPIKIINNENIENNEKENNEKNENNVNKNICNNVVIISKEDKQNIWLNILSFFMPLVGCILFLCTFEKTPKKAKYIGIYSVIGYILAQILSIILSFNIFTPHFNFKYDPFDDDFFKDHYDFEIKRDYDM